MNAYLVNTLRDGKSYVHLMRANTEKDAIFALRWLCPAETFVNIHKLDKAMNRYIAVYETEGTQREEEIFAINDDAALEAWYAEPLSKLLSINEREQRGSFNK